MKKYNIDIAREKYLENGLILLENEYINTTVSMNYKCKDCGYKSKNNLNNIIKSKAGCKSCKDTVSANNKRFNIDYAKQIFLNNNLLLIDFNYINARTPMKYKCLTCNYIGKNTISHIKNRKQGCPDCYYKNNMGENHWNWNKEKTKLNQIIRIKKSKNWIKKNMKTDPLYYKWLSNSKDYEIHHEPQINDYCYYIIENNLIANTELIMYFRDIANKREQLQILPLSFHKQIHKNACYRYNKDKFEQFLTDNNVLENFQFDKEINLCL